MSDRAFFDSAAKERTKRAIQAVEAQTSAEVVVTLRRVSGDYRAADALAGTLLAVGSALALLYLPHAIERSLVVIDVALTYAIGAIASRTIPWLRRALTPSRLRAANVHAAARAAFVDQGISKTSGRFGVLVYLAMFERTVEVVCDVGVDPKAIAGFDAIVAELRASIAAPDLDRFLAALEKLGPALGAALAPREGDENELPDEVDARQT